MSGYVVLVNGHRVVEQDDHRFRCSTAFPPEGSE